MRIVICLMVVGLWDIAAAAEPDTRSTADKGVRLQKLLKRLPDADSNGHGKLSQGEAKASRQEYPPTTGKKKLAPTMADIAYGPHERNVLDLWQAKSDKPTPLVVFIHGGGFVNGDKGSIRGKRVIQACLDAGVSFASINYRFRNHAPIQDILRDAARAIQYVRSRAKEWNIDPERIAAFGGSAGAGTSLWLAVHDDLADPKADDPVLRESSRLTAAGLLNGQASYDLRDWDKLLGPAPFSQPEQERLSFYGFKSTSEMNAPDGDKVMKDCGMIGLITKDDPPIVAACAMPEGEPKDRGHYVHHPKHASAIGDKCKENGVESLVILADDGNRDEQQAKVVKFLLEKLAAKAR